MLIALTIIFGLINPTLGIVVSFLFVAILGFKAHFIELLILTLFMLLMSDSRTESLFFFQDAKKVGLLVLGGIVILASRRYVVDRNVIFMLFLPFLIWSLLITIFRSPELVTGLQKIISYSLLFFSIPLIVQIMMKEDSQRFLRALIIFIGLYLSLGILAYFMGYEIAQLSGRFRGFMGNPNGLGVVVFLFAILYDTVVSKYPELLTRRMTIFMWLVIIANLLLCGSRSALAAFLIYMLFRSFRFLKGFLGFLAFVTALFLYQLITLNITRIISVLGLSDYLRVETIESGSGRLIAWEFAWEQIQNSFFLGRGFHYTELLFKDNYRMLSQLGHQGNAHNSYLTFWLDTGLIGVVLYLSAFFLMFFRIAKENPNAQAVMYAAMFSVTFESWLTGSLNPMTITLLMILSIMLFKPENSVISIESESR